MSSHLRSFSAIVCLLVCVVSFAPRASSTQQSNEANNKSAQAVLEKALQALGGLDYFEKLAKAEFTVKPDRLSQRDGPVSCQGSVSRQRDEILWQLVTKEQPSSRANLRFPRSRLRHHDPGPQNSQTEAGHKNARMSVRWQSFLFRQ